MQPGDLIRVKNTSTGDPPWWVKLWREKTPVLVMSTPEPGVSVSDVQILDVDGTLKWCEVRRLEVINAAR
jgi:hypothetical protein